MGIVIRQSFKGTVAIYLGVVIGAINLLWVFPKFLTPEEIGLLRVLLEMGMLFALLSQFGAAGIADKFFSYFKDEERKHQGFLFFLLLYSTAGFIVITTFYLLSYQWLIGFFDKRSALLVEYLFHVVPLTLLIMYMGVLEAYSRVHLRIVVPSLVREIFLRVVLSVIVVLYFRNYLDLDDLINLTILSYLAGTILVALYIKNLNKLYLSMVDFKEKKELLKEIARYGIYVFLGSASGIIAARVDILMLTGYSGLDFAGIYSIAFFIATIIEIPRRPISGITSPLIGQFWKSGEIDKIEDVYKKTALIQLIIGMLLFMLIWINIDQILALIPNAETFKAGKYVVLFIAIARVVDMGTGVNGEIIINSPIYKISLVLTLISSALIIGLNYFLIPALSMNGAALSIMINFTIMNLIRIGIIQAKYKIHPFSKSLFLVLLVSGIVYGVASMLPAIPGDSPLIYVSNIFFHSLVISVLFIGLVYFLKVSYEFNKFIDQGIGMVLKK